MTFSQAAKFLKKSKGYVEYWCKQWRLEKNVNDAPNVRPHTATTDREDRRIVQMFEQNPGLSLRAGTERLHRVNVGASTSTIRRRLIEHKLRYRATIRKPLLTDDHIEKRMRWAIENSQTDWSKVIYTDESSFWLSNPLTHTWCTAENRLIARTVKHPQKLHLYGAFCERGFGTLVIFTRILTAERMCDLYQKALLTTANKYYGTGNRDWLLLEDNDPKHKSRLCTQWKERHDVHEMFWPPQSPDCNPIENVWALLKARLKGKTFRSLTHLGNFLKRQWKSFPTEYAKNLSQSMPSRCARVIEKQGEWIKY